MSKTRTWRSDKHFKHNGSRTRELSAVLSARIAVRFLNPAHQKVRLKECALGIIMLHGRMMDDPVRRLNRAKEILNPLFAVHVRLDKADGFELLISERATEVLWSERDSVQSRIEQCA